MISDEQFDRLRDQIDQAAPPITLSEVRARSARRMSLQGRPILLAASLVVVVGLAAVAVAISVSDGTQSVSTGEPSETNRETSSSATGPVPGEGGGWPQVLSATGQKPEVIVSSLATGEIISRFAPPGLANGGLTGATGSPDGRIAAWSGARVAVRADGVTYERALADRPGAASPVAGAIRVLFVPAKPVVWIVASTGGQTQVLQWDYLRDRLSAADAEIPAGSLPAGVGDDGRLVLNSADPYAFNSENGASTATVLGPELSNAPVTIRGSVLALGGNAALVGRCNVPEPCTLMAVDLGTGQGAEVDVGDVDPTAVRSLIGPTIPTETAPLPTGHRGSNRVLVAVAVGAQVPQDQLTVLAVVDLETLKLEMPKGAPTDISAATWSCDGSSIAGLNGLSGGTWHSPSGDGTMGTLPGGTFLYGFGAC